MDDENWFPDEGPSTLDPGYVAISDEVIELSSKLHDADPATIAREQARLRPRADQITDELWRHRALERIDELPDLIRGPQPGRSAQYSQAVILTARVHGFEGPVPDRIAFAEQIKREIGRLSREAPIEDRGTIMRMNSDIIRLIRELRAETR